jgi:hypothetical protein
MRYAILRAGIVANVILLDDPGSHTSPPGSALVAAATAQIGDVYDGTSFSPPPPNPAAEKERARAELAALDTEAGWRVAEALVSALKTKGALADADLPSATRDLLARRAALRQQIAGG